MVGICVMFFFSVKNRGQMNSTVAKISETKDIAGRLGAIEEKLDENYPTSPEEVIAVNNDLMSILYKKEMTDDYVAQYVTEIRKIYSKGLLSASSSEAQGEAILKERAEQKAVPTILISSEIEEVIKVKANGKVSDEVVQVEVMHYTNKGDIKRVYTLVKENDLWKIDRWDAA